jgi:hypothetical protein
VDVAVEQLEVQPGLPRNRAEGDATDGRPPVPPVPGVEDRVLPLGARVRRTVGVRKKPDSSSNAK